MEDLEGQVCLNVVKLLKKNKIPLLQQQSQEEEETQEIATRRSRQLNVGTMIAEGECKKARISFDYDHDADESCSFSTLCFGEEDDDNDDDDKGDDVDSLKTCKLCLLGLLFPNFFPKYNGKKQTFFKFNRSSTFLRQSLHQHFWGKYYSTYKTSGCACTRHTIRSVN